MAILETIIEPDANKPKVVQSTSGRPITQPARERVRVYALDGSFQDVWPVDAREIVSTNPGVYGLTPFEVVSSEQQPEQFMVESDEAATGGVETAGAEAVTDKDANPNRAQRRKSRS